MFTKLEQPRVMTPPCGRHSFVDGRRTDDVARVRHCTSVSFGVHNNNLLMVRFLYAAPDFPETADCNWTNCFRVSCSRRIVTYARRFTSSCPNLSSSSLATRRCPPSHAIT